MISVEEALQQVLTKIRPLGRERVSLIQSQGRVLAENISAQRDIPPWDNSAMDGYALRWPDIQDVSEDHPAILKVLADLPAGRIYKGVVGPGEAIRIMTGAPIPKGADTVVPVEDTEKLGEKVKIRVTLARGRNLRLAGEDVRAKELVLEEGTILRPPHLGMLASLQRSMVSVYQQPRVAILSTGDELLEIDEPWEEGKIINSNSYALAALVRDCGGLPLQIGIAKDQTEDLTSKIQQGLNADLLITSGGVSVGDYDLVKGRLQELGTMNFWKVGMRPGQPQAFGIIGGKPIFGLPGNPVSSMVSFEVFVRPSILKMGGYRNLFRSTLKAILREDIKKKTGLVFFIRCRLIRQEDRLYASLTGEQGSAILSSMVKAQGLIAIPREITHVRAGEEVTVILLDPLFFHTPIPEYLPSFNAEGQVG